MRKWLVIADGQAAATLRRLRNAPPLAALAIALALPGCSNERERPTTPAPKCTRFAAPGRGTVQRLLATLPDGGVGCLRSGSYRGDVTFRRSATLQAAPGERPRVVGRMWISRRAAGSTVRGLELDGRNANDLPSPTVNAHDVRFLGNDVTNGHTAICFDLGSAGYGRADRALLLGNRIHDCGVLPAGGHDHGIYVEAATNVTIEANRIYDNADYGIHFFPDAQSSTVRRNAIYRNGMGVIFSGAAGKASSDNLVEGNVIGGSLRGFNVESYWPPGGPVGSGNVVRRNCLFGGRRDPASGGIRMPPIGFAVEDNVVTATARAGACADLLR